VLNSSCNRKGITLIEVLASVVLVTVGVLGLKKMPGPVGRTANQLPARLIEFKFVVPLPPSIPSSLACRSEIL
jgi:Prokaryotic N-terminal methylation motif